MKVQLLTFALIVNSIAWSQTEHGTVLLVLGQRHGPVAVAADSLAYSWDGNTNQTCKIATVGNKLIIASSGYGGRRNNITGKKEFSTLTTAQEVFSTFSKKQIALKTFGSDFLAAWNKALMKNFNIQLNSYSDLVPTLKDNYVVSPLVVGLGKDGMVTTWISHINFRFSNGRYEAYSILAKPQSVRPYRVRGGETAIVDEILGETTPRGRAWSNQIHRIADPFPDEKLANIWARELVQLTIDNLPSQNFGVRLIKVVGPPVDSIIMDNSGRIEWQEHKPECK